MTPIQGYEWIYLKFGIYISVSGKQNWLNQKSPKDKHYNTKNIFVCILGLVIYVNLCFNVFWRGVNA